MNGVSAHPAAGILAIQLEQAQDGEKNEQKHSGIEKYQ